MDDTSSQITLNSWFLGLGERLGILDQRTFQTGTKN